MDEPWRGLGQCTTGLLSRNKRRCEQTEGGGLRDKQIKPQSAVKYIHYYLYLLVSQIVAVVSRQWQQLSYASCHGKQTPGEPPTCLSAAQQTGRVTHCSAHIHRTLAVFVWSWQGVCLWAGFNEHINEADGCVGYMVSLLIQTHNSVKEAASCRADTMRLATW